MRAAQGTLEPHQGSDSGSPLRELADRISEALDKKLTPTTEALGEWHELVTASVRRYDEHWIREPEFQRYSGRGADWCRRNFERYVDMGLAKLVGSRRYWTKWASPPRRHDVDPDQLRQDIVSSHTQGR